MVIDDTNQTIEITVPERLRLRGINYINMDQGKKIVWLSIYPRHI